MSTHPGPPSDDPDRFDAVIRPHAQALFDLIHAHEETLARLSVTPDASSPLMAQIAEQRRYAMPTASTPIDQALSTGIHLTLASCDHARAICTLVTARHAVIYADKILARAAIEAFARGAWLLRHDLTAAERVRRLANEVLHGHARALKVLRRNDEHEGTDTSAPTAAAIDELIEAGERLELGARQRGRDGAFYVGEPRPTATAVISMLLGEDDDTFAGEAVQSFYSEFVHSNLAGLLHQVVTVDDEDLQPPPPGDLLTRPLVSNAADVHQSLQFVASALVSAGQEMRLAFGWREVDWALTLRRSWSVLRAGSSFDLSAGGDDSHSRRGGGPAPVLSEKV